MRNVWLDGIMGVIVGDALGLPVQFLSREEIKSNPVTDMRGHGTFDMPEGTWSDDGSLTIATLQSIFNCKEIDCEDIMENFADWLVEGKFTPFGYAFDQGNTCTRAITKYMINNDVEKCGITGEWANGNGALMRIMPVCLFAYEKFVSGELTEEEVIAHVERVSALTHNHLRSRMACGIYYFLVKAIMKSQGTIEEGITRGLCEAKEYYQKDISNYTELAHYGRLFEIDTFKQLPEEEINSSGYVVDSLEAAIWSILRTSSFREAALCAVNLGRDTDTVGAIACGLAGLYYGYDEIPCDWLNQIQCREKIEEKCKKMVE